jgi:hypothetical protein
MMARTTTVAPGMELLELVEIVRVWGMDAQELQIGCPRHHAKR